MISKKGYPYTKSKINHKNRNLASADYSYRSYFFSLLFVTNIINE